MSGFRRSAWDRVAILRRVRGWRDAGFYLQEQFINKHIDHICAGVFLLIRPSVGMLGKQLTGRPSLRMLSDIAEMQRCPA